jgi:hypothetical protein
MPYYKALWEPMWLVKRAVKDIHPDWHEMALNPETSPLAIEWRKWERERIIELIKSQADEPCCCFSATFGQHNFADIIDLIKGEEK